METDYRKILKNEMISRCQKNSSYSLRAFARDLHISPQRLSHILNGKHGLSPKAAEEITDHLGLEKSEKELFCTLVQKNHARSKVIKNDAQKKIQVMKSRYKNLNLEQFKIISDWYHFAIMELTLINTFSNEPKWIAKTLEISELEASMAIERLLQFQFLIKDNFGHLKLNGQYFTDPQGVPSDAVKSFHLQLIKKSQNALSFQSLSEREFVSTILAIDESDISEAKKDIKEFRDFFDKKYSNKESKTKVYAFCMQFFNLITKNN